MERNAPLDQLLVLIAVKYGQPGLLSDIAEAYSHLSPSEFAEDVSKDTLREQLEGFIGKNYVWLYSGRRYMLTRQGERYVVASGLRLDVDARRLYLLKETRQRSLRRRSDTRDWPLKQRS